MISNTYRMAFLFLMFYFSLTCALFASPSKGPKRILILASYHQSHEWTQKMLFAIRSDLEKLKPAPKIDVDDYNAILSPDPHFREQLWLNYLQKLKEGQYDILVLLDNPAVDQTLATYGELPSNIPVVIAGYEYTPQNFKQKYPGITGVMQESNAIGTLRIALDLYPDTKRILILSDNSVQSVEFENKMKQRKLYFNGISPEFLNTAGHTTEEIFKFVDSLPQESVVMLSRWRGLYGNDYQTLEAFAEDFRGFCKRPFFVNGTTMIGHGALGGYATDPLIHGHETARIIEKVLKTGDSRSEPLVRGRITPFADYPTMKANNLNAIALPADTVMMNTPESLLWKYRFYWISGAIAFFIFFVIVVLYLMEMKRILKKSRDLYNILPGRVGVIDKNEKILFLKTEPIDGFDIGTMKYLKDIPGIDYKRISNAFRQVFQTGKVHVEEYEFRSMGRTISIAPAPKRLFGRDAVIWLSHDSSELQTFRRKTLEIQRAADIERQLLIDNVSAPVWLYDAVGHLIRCNTSAQILLGKKSGSFPEDAVRLAIQDKTAHRSSFRFEGGDYLIDARPVLNDTGRLLYVVESGMDVTELNSVIDDERVINDCWEALLREADMNLAIRNALQMLCEHVRADRAFIFHCDFASDKVICYKRFVPEGKEMLFPSGETMLFGSTAQLAERFSDKDYLKFPDLREGRAGKLEYLAQHGVRSVYAHRLILEGRFWGFFGLLYEGTPYDLNDRDFNFLRASAHFIEVMIRRKLLLDQLVEALDHARSAEKAKSSFIASVSHEIRTPLNAVIGFSELLRDTQVSLEEQRDYLNSIAVSGNALLQLINDVLDLSKLEADQMRIIPEPTDFILMGREIMQVFAFRAREKNLDLRIETPNLPIMELDKLRIRQILFNLTGNAVKFTDAGSITLRAEFHPDPKKTGMGLFRFSVTDTGKGISAENQKKLMQPFVQLAQTRSTDRTNNGTGLGLAISKRLVEKMGGSITLSSELSKGSTFTITLPSVPFHTHSETVIADDSPSKTAKPYTGLVSILLVDDIAMNLKVMSALIGKAGTVRLRTASNGAEALARMKEERPDLVLTDMWMPGMSGAELASKIRETPEISKVPIVVVTADVEMHGTMSSGPFSGILLKPVTMEKIRGVVEYAHRISSGERIEFTMEKKQ